MTDTCLPPPAPGPPPPASVFPPEPAPRAVPGLRAVGFILAAAVAADIAVRSGAATLAAGAFLVVLAVGLIVSTRTRRPTCWLLAAAAVAVAAWVPVRASPWLVPIDLLVALGLIVGAAGYGHEGRLRDLTFVGAWRRGNRALRHLATAPAALAGNAAQGWRGRRILASERAPEVVRGVVLALPMLAALGLLLASADAVFASFFRLPLDPPGLLGHLIPAVVGALLATGLLADAGAQPEAESARRRWILGPVEATILLAGLVALYALFAASQLVVALVGADHVLDTAGLTYAEYAREGFFQLLLVAGITLVILISLRGLVRPEGRRARRTVFILAETAVALTLVIVAVALSRLRLYDDVYGLTMLRLSSTVAAWWIGGVFVLVGLSFAGVGRRQDWLAAAVGGLAVLTLVGFNAANPEALVVNHNVDRDHDQVPFDPYYLVGLSDDAVSALESALPRLDPAVRQQTVDAICADHRGGDEQDPGLAAWNRSAVRAAEARARLGC